MSTELKIILFIVFIIALGHSKYDSGYNDGKEDGRLAMQKEAVSYKVACYDNKNFIWKPVVGVTNLLVEAKIHEVQVSYPLNDDVQ